ncbi:hypothetical protein CGLAU_07410 [Corynebacterium glaucum]|uniref:Antitoxin HicB n=1 Tax=Corynebacterium glaucum TaxID=187491 RepID=A0A1Q2HX49_9CORY|nr:hypothetical protein [Corynebacterium glaucum]AQQ15437.1 hypothetical protein CGLAU_07410 [Corynebacterium glaucum]WJZ07937.1 hypothetical protein CGLAUT_07280 [Corynebacterium glaucum]
MRIFTVTAERGRGPVWVLECKELGVVSQTRRLDRARDEVSEAIAYMSGLDESEFEIAIEPVLGAELEVLRSEAMASKREAAEAADRASAASRKFVEQMKAHGFTVREMGTLLGVSYQRAAALAAG